MLTSWANHIAIAALGGMIGTLARLQTLLLPPEWRSAGVRGRREDESYLDAVIHRSEEQSEIMSEAMATSAALRRVNYALLAVIAVLILIVAVSPVDLGWWTLAISLVVGALVIEAVYRLARAGRLTPTDRSLLDPLSRPARE